MTCQDLGGGRVLSDPEGTSLRSSGSPREHSLAAAAELVPVSHANIEKNALLAPIYKLPMELLAEIFSLACEFTIYELVEGFPTILTISYTCRWWRDVIHGLPELWARIPLYVLYDALDGNIETPFSYRAIARRAQLILKRCNDDTPLEWHVRCDADSRDMWTELDEVLFEETRLWRHLVLNTPGLFRDGRKPLPNLRRLDTYSDYIKPEDDPECSILHAENLCTLHLVNRSFPLPALAPLPWAQLTTLMTTMSAAAGLAVVDLCPVLEQWTHCQPGFQTSIEGAGPDSTSLTQPTRLRSLTLLLAGSEEEEALQILDHLRAPQLEHWHFLMYQDGPLIHAHVHSFLIDFLRSESFESLEELELRARQGAPITDSYIADLALPALPHLKKLTLNGDVTANRDAATTRAMVADRLRAGGTFELNIVL
ncbi:hypothetical protein K523DRAFT_417894 [Schizophyllum commune Tattone D]|nr:hypothetical protein K523DRAFT_417894 [Schizophyllum commune Tattone D]